MVKTILLGMGLAISAALLASTQTADAQKPTPTAVSDLELDTAAAFGLIGSEPRIAWRATPGVDHFRLTATLHAVRVNRADPFCSPPAQRQTITVTVDETLPGTATEFRVTFPPLAGNDSWFVFSKEERLDAMNGAGDRIGSDGGGGVAEALCGRPQPTATSAPPVALPSTGAGGQTHDDPSASIVAAVTASLLLAFGLVWRAKFTR